MNAVGQDCNVGRSATCCNCPRRAATANATCLEGRCVANIEYGCWQVLGALLKDSKDGHWVGCVPCCVPFGPDLGVSMTMSMCIARVAPTEMQPSAGLPCTCKAWWVRASVQRCERLQLATFKLNRHNPAASGLTYWNRFLGSCRAERCSKAQAAGSQGHRQRYCALRATLQQVAT